MSKMTRTLVDTASGQYLEQLSLGQADVPRGLFRFGINVRRLMGGMRGGMQVVELDNGRLRLMVLPERGMGIWKAWLGDVELGWKAPVAGPVHPQHVPVNEAGGLGWLVGFDELLCRCGLESNGAPDLDAQGNVRYPLHGKIANLPAHQVSVSVDEGSGEIAVTGVVDESRLHFAKLRLTSTVSTLPNEAAFTVRDTVTNLSASPGEFQMLYHINLGAPLLEAGARVLAPIKTLVPRNAHAAQDIDRWNQFSGPQAGYVEQVYFADLAADAQGDTLALLRNRDGTRGASVHFNVRELPCFLVWKNTTSEADGYVTGIEPGTNFPNPRSFEKAQGRVVTLQPGESRELTVRIEFHTDGDSVARATNAIAALQRQVEPRIFEQPQPGWCAG
jgi:galactose mutarotase-like enzyme